MVTSTNLRKESTVGMTFFHQQTDALSILNAPGMNRYTDQVLNLKNTRGYFLACMVCAYSKASSNKGLYAGKN